MEDLRGDKKQLVKTVVIALIAVAIFKAFGFAVHGIEANEFIMQLIKELVLLAGAIAAVIICKMSGVLKFTTDGVGAGILAGLFLIIMDCYLLLTGLALGLVMEDTFTIKGFELVLFLLAMLLVGIAEETLFRGLVQNAFHKFFCEDSKKHVLLAILCSGIIFGLLHFFNVFTGVSVTGALVQAIANIPMGMFFGAVYFRSKKNLWLCIVLHAFHDIAVSVQSGVLWGVDITQTISSYNPMALIPAGIILLIVLFLLRNKKVEPLLKNKELEE